jgi:hypothetical protein
MHRVTLLCEQRLHRVTQTATADTASTGSHATREGAPAVSAGAGRT